MKRKNVKGMVAGALAMSMMVGAPGAAFAQQPDESRVAAAAQVKAKKPEKEPESTQTKAKSQEVGKVTCTSSGKVNVSFKQKVTYTDVLKAVITDANGGEMPCKILKKNKNLMSVSVSGLVKGQTYTLTGMKTQNKVGKTQVTDGKFVILKMNSAAFYKDATVSVTDSQGNACDAKIVKKAKGNLKVMIAGMKKGEKYTITINGIKTKKEKSYSSITKSVTIK